MKLSSKGIGWLIAGALICAAAFPGDGIADMVSTIMIGLVFIAIYFLKQRFKPRGLGWFIAGGIMTAYLMDCLLDMAGGMFSQYTGSSDFSDRLFSSIFACFFLLMFYRSNKVVLDDIADGAEHVEESEFPYQEEVFTEETVTVETEKVVKHSEDNTNVEIEVTDGK